MRYPLALALLAAVACAPPYQPPAPPVPRDATPVAAPFGATWDAVIDQFAANNIPVLTIDRASGFIATDELRAPAGQQRGELADCGEPRGLVRPDEPTHVRYNVLVRGDSSRATVKATAAWRWVNPRAIMPELDCSTSHAWERAFEAAVKARAES